MLSHYVKKCMLIMTLILMQQTLLAANNGQQILEEKCTLCHDIPNPEQLSKEEWTITVNEMAMNAGLSDDETSSVLDYVSSKAKGAAAVLSMQAEKELFETKCSLCHSTTRALIMPMTPESVKEIVRRMQVMAGDWINDDQAHNISEYLVHGAPESIRPKRTEIARSDPYALFLQRCTACHTAEQVYSRLKISKKDATAAGWLEIVNRMQVKAPNWITSSEAKTITKFLEGL